MYSTLYSNKQCIDITTSITWTPSTRVIFIPVMHFSNGAQFLRIAFILEIFASASAAAVFATITVPLKSMYASL